VVNIVWAIPGKSPVLGFPSEWREFLRTSILRFWTEFTCWNTDWGSISTLVFWRVKCNLLLRTPCNTRKRWFILMKCSSLHVLFCKSALVSIHYIVPHCKNKMFKIHHTCLTKSYIMGEELGLTKWWLCWQQWQQQWHNDYYYYYYYCCCCSCCHCCCCWC